VSVVCASVSVELLLSSVIYDLHFQRVAPIWVTTSGAARGAGGTAPRNWVHKKIPGCAVELNTQNCAWFGSQISLITVMSFRGAMPPPKPPTRGSAPGPRWGTSVPQTPCAPHLQILAAPLVTTTHRSPGIESQGQRSQNVLHEYPLRRPRVLNDGRSSSFPL